MEYVDFLQCYFKITVQSLHYSFPLVSPLGGVSSSPAVHNSQRNETVQFSCLSNGGPGNVFSWTRVLDGFLISMSHLLVVNVVGEFDGGLYSCGVSNRAGNGSFQAALNGQRIVFRSFWLIDLFPHSCPCVD